MFKRIINKCQSAFSASKPNKDKGSGEVWQRDYKYPPDKKGVPFIPSSQIYNDQEVLIRRIRGACLADEKEWQQYYLPPILAYIDFVHLLPASERNHHRLLGGLVNHGLEVALLASQLAGKHMFGLDALPRNRVALTKCWHLAAFIGGLCHDIGKPCSDMKVVDESGEHEWNPFMTNICDWGKANRIKEYYITWRKDDRHKRHEAIAPLLLDKIINTDAKAYMVNASPEILKQLMLCLEGEGFGVLQEIVKDADAQSTKRDKREMGVVNDGVGNPVFNIIIATMASLIEKDIWKVNAPGSVVWYIDNALYVVWPNACETFNDAVKARAEVGVPRNADSIADILLEHGSAEPNGSNRYWWIAPDSLTAKSPNIKLSALRLTNPNMLFQVTPEPVGGKIVPVKSPDKGQQNSQNEEKAASTETVPFVDGEPVFIPENEQQGESMGSVSQEPTSEEEKIRQEVANTRQMSGEAPPILPYTPHVDVPTEYKPDNQTLIRNAGNNTASEKNGNRPDDYHLMRLGDDGSPLLYIAEDLKKGDLEWGKDACIYEGKVALRHPATLKGYGIEPKVIVARLLKANHIVPDPLSPTKNVQAIPGLGKATARAIVLAEEISHEILKLAGHPSFQGDNTQEAMPADLEQQVTDSASVEEPPKENKPSKKDRETKKKPAPKEATPKPEKKVKREKGELESLLDNVPEDKVVHFDGDKSTSWISVKRLIALSKDKGVTRDIRRYIEGLDKKLVKKIIYVEVNKQ